MALLLSDVVIRGHINNRTSNSVHGWIQLRGLERPLLLNLTGNCAADLSGKCFYFEASETTPIDGASEPSLANLAPRQVGPLGTMTAIGRVQVANCSAEELLRCMEAGRQPPIEWKPSLFLEWYSQNGRVIVELLNATLTFVDQPYDEAEIELDDELELDDQNVLDDDAEDEEDDPYGLFPKGLDEKLSAGFAGDDNSAYDPLDDVELDVVPLLEGDDVPLQILFDPPLKLYPPDILTDRQIDESLQVLLARLARHGVALDMCEHFTPRDAYCLLLEHILPEESVPAGLTESGFIQHYTTHEFCSTCLSQFLMDDPLDDAQQDIPTDEDGLP